MQIKGKSSRFVKVLQFLKLKCVIKRIDGKYIALSNRQMKDAQHH